MYQGNHLAAALRKGSAGRERNHFATAVPGGRSWSYGDLWTSAEKAASALISAGLQPGDRVAVQVEKSLEALALYLGTIIAGGVFLPLNTAYTAAELSHFLQNAGPRIFVCDPAQEAALRPMADEAGVAAMFTLDGKGAGSFAEAIAASAPITAPVPRGPDDLAAILYTSGTTGRSKGAMLTHANLSSNAAALCDLWRFTAKDVLIHALPIFHTHGLFVAVNVTLIAGSSLIYHSKFDARAILADFGRATVLMGVPTFYTRLLELPELAAERLSGMRLFVSGSAPLLAETHKAWQRKTGRAILERYGMTETCMNTSNPYDGVRKPGTVGLPLPGVEVRITDADGKPLPQGEIGGIEVRGPNVFKGYWQLPEQTAAELRADGFFITGDLGLIDADGYLSIIGRSKDLIISGGFNIYPKEIELAVDQIEGVDESAVFGLPHPDFGECVAVAIVRSKGAQIEGPDIGAALSARLAKFKHPRHVFFLDALPRNTMGKVQKNVLREKFKSQAT